jgi:hypothetical protein
MRGLLDNGYILTQLVNKEWIVDEFDELQYDGHTIEHKKVGQWAHVQRGKIEGEVSRMPCQMCAPLQLLVHAHWHCSVSANPSAHTAVSQVKAIQMPRYRQLGEPVELKDGLTYLGVKIVRANVQGGSPSRPPNTVSSAAPALV